MLLMQKYLKPDGVIGIGSARWQSDPLGFLSATASVTTVQVLRKVSQSSYGNREMLFGILQIYSTP